MSQEISKISKMRLERKLEQVSSRLAVVIEQLEEARNKMDLSENSEYDAALTEFTNLKLEQSRIEYTLETAKVRQTYPTSIVQGCLISVQYQLPDGSWKDLGLKFFDAVGGILFEGTITTQSPLGKAINGGTSGEYVVKALNGTDIRYKVKLEPESRLEEYLKMYPPNRDEILDRIFEV